MRAQHAQTDARLHELSEQLAASSLRHETATRELSQANTIKDKYLRYYMQRSTFYINKLERHRTHLYKTALSYGQERLLRELRSPTPIEQEYKSFFHEFDRVFLSLYPDFVEKANALLRDGEQMKTPGLNTEFRLLAVIRLGITGNSEIAQFLANLHKYGLYLPQPGCGTRQNARPPNSNAGSWRSSDSLKSRAGNSYGIHIITPGLRK